MVVNLASWIRKMTLKNLRHGQSSTAASWLPFGMVASWLIFVATTVWLHARRTDFPPIYDALSYFEKAKNFWGHLATGKFFNPFNLEPTFRPPGTILLSYPFGFDIDYRPFYFRSVFVPLLCLAVAACMAGYSRRSTTTERWNLAFLALLLTTLPLFYHFEIALGFPGPGLWGLVDNFLAGMLALAAGACVLYVQTLSRKWLVTMIALAAFAVLIKPSGALVMTLIAASWLFVMVLRLRHPLPSDPAAGIMRRRIFFGLALAGIIYGAVLAVSLSTRYLDYHGLAQGALNIAIMKAELQFSLRQFINLVHTSYGFVLPVGVVLIVLLALRYPRQLGLSRENERDYMAVYLSFTAVGCTIVGLWFWLDVSGGVTQVRYLAPFTFVALVLATPLGLRIVGQLRTPGTVAFRVLCIAPVLNMGLLLIQNDPSAAWQHLTGVNLSVGKSSAIIRQANDLIETARANGKSAFLYTLTHDIDDAVFSGVAEYRRLVESPEPTIYIRRPVDWSRPTAIRIPEILKSDYVLFDPVRDDSAISALLNQRDIRSFDAESQVFAAWFSRISIDKGVEVVADSPTNRLVRVSDPAKLKASLDELKKAHTWRDEFIDSNLSEWWSKDQLAEFARSRGFPTMQINYRDLFRVHAVTADWLAGHTAVKLRVWWEPLREPDGFPWFLFIHSVNDHGEIIVNNKIELSRGRPEDAECSLRFDELLFAVPRGRGIHRVAVGIFRPQPIDEQLAADAGPRDWDNRRVLIPIHFKGDGLSVRP
jgi:hypothetical protein